MSTRTKKPQANKAIIKKEENNGTRNSVKLSSPAIHYYSASSSYYSSSTTNSNGNEIKTKIEVHEQQDKKGNPKISGTYDKIVNGRSKEHKKITNKNISSILISSKK